jgi:hypothetical protein
VQEIILSFTKTFTGALVTKKVLRPFSFIFLKLLTDPKKKKKEEKKKRKKKKKSSEINRVKSDNRSFFEAKNR